MKIKKIIAYIDTQKLEEITGKNKIEVEKMFGKPIREYNVDKQGNIVREYSINSQIVQVCFKKDVAQGYLI